jgi:hypothetical protein
MIIAWDLPRLWPFGYFGWVTMALYGLIGLLKL